MELLNPTPPPPGLAGNHFAGFATPADFPARFDRENRTLTSQLPEITEDDGDRVYVAVGKSMERSIGLLRWTFKRFGHGEIGIIHVHQPSPLIPTLLGKLPASQANNESLSAYRREEREQTRKLLLNYLNVCGRAKVKANIITDEAGQVNTGIVDLVKKHGIKKLVMGAVTESCMKVKKNSSKANYAARNAPAFCQIWFVNKGKHVWTREASEDLSPFETLHSGRLRSKSLRCHEDELKFDLQSSSTPRPFGGVTNWIQTEPEKIEGALQASLLRSRSLQCHENVPKFDLQSRSSTRSFGGVANRIQTGPDKIEGALQARLMSSTKKSNLHHFQNQVCSKSTSSASGYTSSAEKKESSDSDSNLDVESLYNQLTEARIEAEESKDEAFAELLKRKNLETEAVEAFDKVIAFEAAIAHEVKLRKEVEDLIRTTKHEQEKLLEQREEVTRKLHKTMRNVAVLDSHAREARSRQEEAAGELRLIQASIANLRHERKKIRKQKAEAVRWLERWKNREHAGGPTCNGFVSDSPECEEFSLLDLQTATCNFSECFKIGQGGFGCVYKGEIFERSVAIKKLHPHNIQGRSEFQQEVQVLSKLQHPHLVTLLGACLEAWCLVYEYLPNGGLQDHLFPKINTIPLTWKTRTRIAAQISSAILFLHSSKPEKIIHGDLKPENIMLDSEFNCKIGDFGICRLVPEETVYSPKFHQNSEPKGAFPYSDPEFHKTGWLTPKSDIYAFGIIILQLLTGKPPLGLAAEVRRAVSCGKLLSILDASAGEWPTFVARRLVDLGLKCCELNSRDRPDLTLSVVRELERLHITEEQSIPSFFLCPILQEIMHDPQVAADGFTYEGEALRGWLENGRDTSPMTNLKLSHLHLTPNHALRHAIDEWLCKS